MTVLPASEKEGRVMLKELKDFVMRGNILDVATDFQFYHDAFNVLEKE